MTPWEVKERKQNGSIASLQEMREDLTWLVESAETVKQSAKS
jgi:hypothetical protein